MDLAGLGWTGLHWTWLELAGLDLARLDRLFPSTKLKLPGLTQWGRGRESGCSSPQSCSSSLSDDPMLSLVKFCLYRPPNTVAAIAHLDCP